MYDNGNGLELEQSRLGDRQKKKKWRGGIRDVPVTEKCVLTRRPRLLEACIIATLRSLVRSSNIPNNALKCSCLWILLINYFLELHDTGVSHSICSSTLFGVGAILSVLPVD